MQIVDLRAGIETYEALSYAWGPLDTHREIWLNWMPFRVTENLYRALRSLRSKKRDRILWVDALAINQLDIKERNHQVERMTNIYHDAKRVLMWIGESPDRIGRIVVKRFFEIMFPTTANSNPDHWTWDRNMLGILSLAHMQICSSNYWRRLWVQQETAHARECVVICRSRTVEYSQLAEAMNCLLVQLNFLSRLRILDQFRVAPDGRYLYPDNVGQSDISNSRGILSVPAPGCIRNAQWMEPLTWLPYLSGKECKDPRDYVYAFYACLPPQIRSRIRADYALPIAHVFKNAAEAVIKTTGSLNIICWGKISLSSTLELNSANESEIPIPTWVPNLQYAARDCLTKVMYEHDEPLEADIKQKQRLKRFVDLDLVYDSDCYPATIVFKDRRKLHVHAIMLAIVETKIFYPVELLSTSDADKTRQMVTAKLLATWDGRLTDLIPD
jgi:hypothetical protein